MVEDEPIVLHNSTAVELRISGLGLLAAPADATASGAAFYEISVSGVGVGGDCQPCIYAAKLMATPYALKGRPGLALSQSTQSLVTPGSASGAGVLGARVLDPSTVLIELRAAVEARELVVEVRRAGQQCAAARVSM